jgi:dUTP pyrophosphatase
MTDFTSPEVLGNHFLDIYGRYMKLKILVDGDDDLKDKYVIEIDKHNHKASSCATMIDAGFDLYAPKSIQLKKDQVNKIDYQICCSAQMFFYNAITLEKSAYNTGFYMYPRSSISKTPIRLANNVGIIDAGYRGHLMGMFDVIEGTENEGTLNIDKFERHLQVCAPGLVPIIVEMVQTKDCLGEKTERGSGGFGSTGR